MKEEEGRMKLSLLIKQIVFSDSFFYSALLCVYISFVFIRPWVSVFSANRWGFCDFI
jgi:hypothetical protein